MLKSFGWSSSQFSCLKPLWQHEHLERVRVQLVHRGLRHPAGGARFEDGQRGSGLETNASTQIKWGLGYIKDTYGSPCAAWSHEQADGWY